MVAESVGEARANLVAYSKTADEESDADAASKKSYNKKNHPLRDGFFLSGRLDSN